jgi:hypothetical protein
MDGLAEIAAPEGLEMGPIGPEYVPALWEVLHPLLQRACDFSGGRFTPESVAHQILNRSFDLWGVARPSGQIIAVAVTCVSDYPTGLRVMEVLLVSGQDRQSWLHFQGPLREQAARWGCQKMQMVGRKGWAKSLPDWNQAAVMFEIEVNADGR